ncbi:MAG: J domain-containing protein [Alphaproteobacteria bacterium]|nr:J domain-containing protein [Alphaproteobacteria bacterium]
MRDPYTVLGVAKSASEAEIKKAFRALAKKHHPDTHPGDANAAKRFQEVSGAYDILGDKEKRAKFDRGEIDASGNPRGFEGAQGFRGGPYGSGPGGGREYHFEWGGPGSPGGAEQAQGFRPEDIFADLFGGGRRKAQPQPGQDYAFDLTVGFEEAAKGATRRLSLPDGREIDVRIPPGLKDGQQIRLRGQGGPGQNGGPAGDVRMTVTVAGHPWFTRDGNDLRMDLPVTLKEAILGGSVTVPTLTGPVALKVPAGANSGTVLRLKGKGIAAKPHSGDLYVRLVVTLPEKHDADLMKFAEHWKANYDPRSRLK